MKQKTSNLISIIDKHSGSKRTGSVFFLFLMGFMLALPAMARQEYTFSGTVEDAETGEGLAFANIYILGTGKGVTTNAEGAFSIELQEGEYSIRITYTGYETTTREINLTGDLSVRFAVESTGLDVEEVEILGDRRARQVETTQMGRIDLEMERIASLPVLFGEIDILETLQLTPGIQSSSEGSSSLNVRGGGPDQNLILLDGAPIYNPSHLFGFFSVFHPDAVDDFTLIKGDMPPRYGGRLSSVLDVNQRKGNEEEFNVRGGIGLISSRGMVEGPLGSEGNGGFMFAARRTYIDLLVQPVLPPDLKGNRYYFYDMSGKAHYRLNARNTLSLSAYLGRDRFVFSDGDEGLIPIELESDWGNKALSLEWDRVINNDLYATYTAYYSDYDFSFNFGDDLFTFGLFSGVRDIGGRARFNYFPSNNREIRFGIEAVNHEVNPGIGEIKADDEDFGVEVSPRRANEFAVYAEDEWAISNNFTINYGLRYSFFNQVGPYRSLEKNELGMVEDTIEYASWENVQNYSGLEPRISANYRINELTAAKISYTRNRQYIHLASFTGGTLPTDLWIPSSKFIKPQISDQIATGIFRELPGAGLDVSFEVYHKWLDNQIDFRPGADLILNPFLDEEFLQGTGRSYGAEVFLEKNRGKLTGWIGYTLAETKRTIPGINNGEPYSPRFDITHDVSFVSNYKLNEQWDFSFVFVYATGRPFTPQLGQMAGNFGVSPEEGPGFSRYPIYADELNTFRTEHYHRADVSVNYRPNRSENKRYKSYWNFSVYNVYNRANPYFYDFGESPETGELQVVKVYIFPILPSVTYNFRF